MHRKSKHKETNDLDNSEYPIVKCGYLDNTKQSKNTEIQEEIYDPRGPLEYPVVVRGYLDITKRLNNTETQEDKKDSLFRKIIWSCVFVIFILGTAPKDFGYFLILLPPSIRYYNVLS